jgi:replicative DNA helicase
VNSYERIMSLRREAAKIRSGEVKVPPIIQTGIHALDAKLNGGIPTEKLCVIAARTSHGKTATAVRLAVNIALSKRFVNVLWLEDQEQEFDLRAIAALAHKPLTAVVAARRAGSLDEIIDSIREDRMTNWQYLRTHWLRRPDVGNVTKTITSMAENSVCILDHLGEIQYGAGPRYETMGDALRIFRDAAWTAKCGLIAMTQLNRQWDYRKAQSPNPDAVRPVLSDIENSGQIEQISRVCIIAEKRYVTNGNGQIAPTGQYIYHIWKPYEAIAECRWDDRTATPDNPEAIVYPPKPYQDPEGDD